MGLGDHIICNGLIRNLYRRFDKINLFVCEQHEHSISSMFKDLDNLTIIPIPGHYNDSYIFENYKNFRVIRIGFENVGSICNKYRCSWDESFYRQFDVPFSARWDDFYIQRDENSEKKLFEKLNPNNEKYVLIHSTGSDNIDRIDYSKIDNSMLKIVIEKGSTKNVFDYLGLIENASEIHCISSFFNVLCDSVKTNGNLFYHDKIKRRNYGLSHKLKKNWNLV